MLRSAPGTSRFRSRETIPHRTGLHGAVNDRKVKSQPFPPYKQAQNNYKHCQHGAE